ADRDARARNAPLNVTATLLWDGALRRDFGITLLRAEGRADALFGIVAVLFAQADARATADGGRARGPLPGTRPAGVPRRQTVDGNGWNFGGQPTFSGRQRTVIPERRNPRRDRIMPSQQSHSETEVSREQLAALLNEDLEREYQAIIAYVVYSQV